MSAVVPRPNHDGLKIAVVIAAYNGAQYLEETLRAIFAQQRAPDAVIVVDDCSTDRTAEVAKQFPVTYIRHQVNGGQGMGRNTGIKAAEGFDIIALCDADDIWLETHLGLIERLFTDFPDAGVAFNRVQLFGTMDWKQEQMLPPYQPIDAYMYCLLRNVCTPSASAFRRELAITHGGFTEDRSIGLTEDFEFWTRVSRFAPFVCSDQVTVRYRKHAAQMTTQTVAVRQSEYEVRRRIIESVRAEGDPILLAAVEHVMQNALRTRLREAWHLRRRDLMRTYLGFARIIPGSEDLARHWRWKARLMRLLPLWDRSGVPAARQALRDAAKRRRDREST